jgi:DNA-binding NarL/FixJ family response regulator
MVERIPVGILGDSRLLCEAMTACLARDPQFESIAAASTVYGLQVQLSGRPVEILLVYADSESYAGGIIWDIKTLLPSARAIMLQYHERCVSNGDYDEPLRWIEAGVAAFLPFSTSYATLRETMSAVAQGHLTSPRDALVNISNRSRTLAKARDAERNPLQSKRLTYSEIENARFEGFANPLRFDGPWEVDECGR